MTYALRADYIEEPDLIFGQQRKEKDPRIGLKYHGPYYYSSEKKPTPSQVRIGIVGNNVSIALAKQVLAKLGSPIPSPESNKWLYPDFPGFVKDSPIKCEFVTSEHWEANLREADIEASTSITDPNRRIAATVNLFVDRVYSLSLEDNKPDVVICALPSIVEEYCGISEKTRGAKRLTFTREQKQHAKLSAEGQTFLTEWGIASDPDSQMEEALEREDENDIDLDFHNALKGKIMEYGIPVQLLRESTARGFLSYGDSTVKRTQEPATVAWNLSTALYYKSNGKPWRLAKLHEDTCYVGISFFRNLLSPIPNVHTSMAQVFTHSGEGFVLRGSEVVMDEYNREPHMTKTQTTKLVEDALGRYKARARREPRIITVHKSTQFSPEEREGIGDAIGSLEKNLVTITTQHDIRVARDGDYPVLRGSMIYLSESRCLLFTTGYVPRVRTYPGPGIPSPLLITHEGDSQLKTVCQDIMGLTKLNWNTTAFSTYLPITLEFSRKVGRVLSELPKDKPLQHHYRFYM